MKPGVTHRWILAAGLILALLGCGKPNNQGFAGEYDVVNPLKKNSLDSVVIEAIINFGCSHCYELEGKLAMIRERYKDRVRITTKPIVFSGESDEAVRLFMIADRAGLGEKVKRDLFAAKFVEGKDIFAPQTVEMVADKNRLLEKYRAERDSDWVTEGVKALRADAARYAVSSTPALIIQGSMRVSGNVENLRLIIDQLLN